MVGVGAHHNTDYPNDADRMFSRFVDELRAASHSIAHASFTHGGAEDRTHQPMSLQSAPNPVEILAMELHEAGRSTVEPFWTEITEQAREGSREQAKYLLAKFNLILR